MIDGMTEPKDTLWQLQCKNEKCNEFFDYFGRLSSNTRISCTHCGKSSKHVVSDFTRHNSAE
jgi:hypothetical protein